MRSHVLSIAAAMLYSSTFGELAHSAAPATTFTVNSTGDEVDSVEGDGACRTAAGACTLRAAIQEANGRAGADSVHFAIGSGARIISPASPLPVIFEEVVIDGTTQPGYVGTPLIELDGSAIKVEDVREGPGIDGLVLVNGKTTIRALAISSFGGAAMVLTEGDGNRVEGCWIGTGTSGIEDKGNGGDGIVLLRSSDNIIGGVEARQRNLIAGNDGRGILISDAASSGNVVLGNIIGIAADSRASPNGSQGILILGAPDNVIGGSADAEGNVIAGNEGNGIEISGSSASGNRVEGNLVGARGSDDPANRGTGIVLDGAPNNVIGGTHEARNWIAGNGGDGIAILSGDARGNRVAGNLIGIASDSGTKRGNDGDGILIAGAPENTIGGPISAVFPLEDPTPTPESTGEPPPPTTGPTPTGFPPPSTPIAPPLLPPPLSASHGSAISRPSLPDSWNRTIALPPPPTGDRPSVHESRSRGSSALRATAATTVTHTGNVIGHSAGDGIEISGTGARANVIVGNLIGIDSSGRPAGNRANGIFVTDAPENVVGGDSAMDEGNAIGASARNGIAIVGIGSTGNRIEGNSIGTLPVRGGPRDHTYDTTGGMSNSGEGVLVLGAPANSIGAAPDPDFVGIPHTPGMAPPSTRGNVIAGNSGDGVRIAADGADGNIVAWNAIGILGGPVGDIPIGNGGDGVAIVGGARRNVVTGSTVIASSGHGVSITGAGTELNVVSGNRLGADDVAGNGVEGATATGDGALVRAGASRNEISDNDIDANLRHGIHVHGTGTEGNVVVRNRIRAPGGAGIRLAAGASANRVGGAAAEEEIGASASRVGDTADDVEVGEGWSNRMHGQASGSIVIAQADEVSAWSNRVEAHASGGIVIAHADDNRILWNLVIGPEGGDDRAAAPSEPAAGILVEGARNLIGPGNIVGGQRGDGVALVGVSTVGNRLFGNWIGVGPGSEAEGNAGSGVRISASASDNELGSTAEITGAVEVMAPGRRSPQGNVIAHNGGDGVRIDSGNRNTVAANHIFDNAGLAIDLGGDGRGAGDPGASDAPNRAQPAPEWVSASARADSVRGAANGRPGRALRLELFASQRCRPEGEGDAEVPLARVDVTVGADGLGPFDLDLMPLFEPNPGVLIGRALSATTTDLDGNTSELSRCVALLVPQVFLPVAAR